MLPDHAPDFEPRCSARSCRDAAEIALTWRNPALHDESRVKTWVACTVHEDELAAFLSRRGFLLDRQPLGPTCPPDPASPAAETPQVSGRVAP